MSNFIKKFLQELHKEDIEYVHWKSNTNIEKALIGEDDLDILVNPKDKYKIYKVFKELKIIRTYSEKDSWQNEIFHYFGMDIESKKMIHIHLHFLLEVGFDFDKSFNLPIVKEYISSKQMYKNSIYIPSVESEYILLIIRLILKNGIIPFLLQMPTSWWRLYKKEKKITGSAYKEYVDLKNRSNKEEIDKQLENTFSFIDKNLFYKLEETIEKNNSLNSYFLGELKLRKALKKYSSNTMIQSFFKSIYRINLIRLRKLIRDKSKLKKIPANGGRIIAFVGGDGAGKSSNIKKLSLILSKHLYVENIHIGRPNFRADKVEYIFGHQIRNIGKLFSKLGAKNFGNTINYLGLAIERVQAFKKAQKIKAKGGIVILDRIPLDGITAMDSPRIRKEFGNRYKIFAQVEEKIYEKFNTGIDRLIVLKLNPQIALTRRPDDNKRELLIRSGQIWEFDFSKIENSTVIDTQNSFKYVEKEILKSTWQSITSKPKIIELAGLAGTGKSTLRKALKEIYPEAIYSLKGDGIGFFLLKNTLIYRKLYIQGGYDLFKSLVKMDIFLNRLKKGYYNQEQYLILDQGPIFYAVNITTKLPEFQEVVFNKISDLAQYYDKVIFLEAQFDILCDRIDNREQNHRIKHKDIETKIEFLKNHIRAFKKVLKVMYFNGVNINGIDTSLKDPKEIKDIVYEIIKR